MVFLRLLLGASLTFVTGSIIPRFATVQTSTECYGQDLSVACPGDSHIGIASFNHGFKAVAQNCPLDGTAIDECCVFNSTDDCLQTDPTETRYVDALSGKTDGIISTSSVTATSGGACDNVSFSPTSVFSKLDFICIPGKRIGHLCTETSINTTNGEPAYLNNRNYPSSGILDTDTACDCSVEALGTEPIQMFTLHMDLYNTPEDCRQNLTLTDRDGVVLMMFQCESQQYNTIEMRTLNSSYVKITMTNTNTVTNTGKFFLAFQASTFNIPVILSCPSIQPIRVIRCGDLTDPANGQVHAPNTSYGAMATYTCNQGYVQSGGDVRRMCQANSTWSGEELLCTRACDNLTDPNNGVVKMNSTSLGAVATYECNPGYKMSSTSRTRVCQMDGTWSGKEPTCDIETACNILTDPNNGVVKMNSTSLGGVATYECDPGYKMSSTSRTRVCQKDGTWSGKEPTCDIETACNILTNPNDGVVKMTSTSLGAVATYECNPGYKMSSTNRTRVCQKDGTWSGMELTCNAKTDDEDADSMSPGTIIGIVVAIVGVLVIIFGIAYKCGICKEVKKYVVNRRHHYQA